MYREVTMIEITEVLRLWRDGVPKKRIAARLGLDPKTVRRYITVAEETGLRVGAGEVSETQLRDVLVALHPQARSPQSCSTHHHAASGRAGCGSNFTSRAHTAQTIRPSLFATAIVALLWPRRLWMLSAH
jgi:hypothetical protein